ncbi:hypothetical protein HK44_027695 [Pseudomonas fluorescens HK44]|uniref:Uncharacterized protein n=1 Tax=Pseudomonas fluorescens HK44 TaxID=1042209 RepID=A0A010SQ04_PSEFL|nr:hypothetical protein HK44_027695 [Pseudomonas fluorescens HK44]
MLTNKLGRLLGSQFVQMLVQFCRFYAPNIFKLLEFFLQGGPPVSG